MPRARAEDSPSHARAGLQGLREGLLGKAWRSGRAEVGGQAGRRPDGPCSSAGVWVEQRRGTRLGKWSGTSGSSVGGHGQPQKVGEQEGRGPGCVTGATTLQSSPDGRTQRGASLCVCPPSRCPRAVAGGSWEGAGTPLASALPPQSLVWEDFQRGRDQAAQGWACPGGERWGARRRGKGQRLG